MTDIVLGPGTLTFVPDSVDIQVNRKIEIEAQNLVLRITESKSGKVNVFVRVTDIRRFTDTIPPLDHKSGKTPKGVKP